MRPSAALNRKKGEKQFACDVAKLLRDYSVVIAARSDTAQRDARVLVCNSRQ